MTHRKMFGIGFASVAIASAVALASCKDDPHLRSDGGSVSGGSGACVAKAGELPAPDCDNSSKDCTREPGCNIDEGTCGAASTCLPLANNSGKRQQDFRFRRLNVAAPEALAAEFIQKTVVTANVDLDAKQCGEVGKGLFSWLARIDRDTNELLTGGAPPPRDPLKQGFCFARFNANGIPIEPARLKIAFEGNTFKTVEKQRLNVPVFLSDDLASSIVLPLSDVIVQGVTVSSDGNCIGKLNTAGIRADCTDDPGACSKWTTAGALGGYMTLEEADAVIIRDLSGRSLCVVLSRGVPGPDGRCKRTNGVIDFKGDYCSKDKQAGSCQDSVWLAATFAASAVNIFDGAGVPGCSGAGTRDAGPDSPPATDAGRD